MLADNPGIISSIIHHLEHYEHYKALRGQKWQYDVLHDYIVDLHTSSIRQVQIRTGYSVGL